MRSLASDDDGGYRESVAILGSHLVAASPPAEVARTDAADTAAAALSAGRRRGGERAPGSSASTKYADAGGG